jgi:threonine dehydratase
MDVPSRKDAEAAAERTAGFVRRTPVVQVEAGTLGAAPVALKLELLQHTGSFKARGAFNTLLAAREAGRLGSAGVVAASGGNAGAAVAFAARHLGVRSSIFVPQSASPVKLARLRALGAEVQIVGAFFADAYAASVEHAAMTGALQVHAYDQFEVVAGQGTLGLELMEQVLDVDTVLVAVGGGGLIGGIATAVDGRAKIVSVEPERIPTLHQALRHGGPVDVEVSGIGADALGARRAGEISYDICSRLGVSSVLVTDQAIVEARHLLWDRLRIASEYAGATGLAALLSGAYEPVPGERVAVVVCGGNTDPGDLA